MSDHEAWLVATAAVWLAVAFLPRDKSWAWRVFELLVAYGFLYAALENT
jgi:hypothetical protein